MSIEMVLMGFSVLSFMVNASVWYRIGSIKSRVEQCENFKNISKLRNFIMNNSNKTQKTDTTRCYLKPIYESDKRLVDWCIESRKTLF